jgi:hypothetical protein
MPLRPRADRTVATEAADGKQHTDHPVIQARAFHHGIQLEIGPVAQKFAIPRIHPLPRANCLIFLSCDTPGGLQIGQPVVEADLAVPDGRRGIRRVVRHESRALRQSGVRDQHASLAGGNELLP